MMMMMKNINRTKRDLIKSSAIQTLNLRHNNGNTKAVRTSPEH
jgi:hypothetical protein